MKDPALAEHVESCPLCLAGEEMHAPFEDVLEGDLTITYGLCERCGMVFQTKRMTEAALEQYYAGAYRALVQGTEEPTEKDLRMQSGRARHMVRFARTRLKSVSRHLDIGSSSGALMRESRATWGADVVGIEPGDAYREYSSARGLTTVRELNDLDGRRFDLITMSHVLEHLPDPVGYLNELRVERLEPEGHILIEVPNLYGHQSLELSHTVAFSGGTLSKTLHRSGYRVVHLASHSEPRSRWLSLYLLVLAQATGSAAVPEEIQTGSRGVRLGRTLGNMRRNRLTQLAPGFVWKPLPEIA